MIFLRLLPTDTAASLLGGAQECWNAGQGQEERERRAKAVSLARPGSVQTSGAREAQVTLEQSVRLDHLGLDALES